MHVRPALIAALCLTLGPLGAASPSATPAVPDTAEGRRLSAFLEAAPQKGDLQTNASELPARASSAGGAYSTAAAAHSANPASASSLASG